VFSGLPGAGREPPAMPIYGVAQPLPHSDRIQDGFTFCDGMGITLLLPVNLTPLSGDRMTVAHVILGRNQSAQARITVLRRNPGISSVILAAGLPIPGKVYSGGRAR